MSLALWRMDTELAPIIAAGSDSAAGGVIGPVHDGAVEPPPYRAACSSKRGRTELWRSPQMPVHASPPTSLPRLDGAVDEAVNLPTVVGRAARARRCRRRPTWCRTMCCGELGRSLPNEDRSNRTNPFQFFEGNQRSNPPQAQDGAATDKQARQSRSARSQSRRRRPTFEQRGKRYQSAAQQSLMNSAASAVRARTRQPNLDSPTMQTMRTQPADEQVGVSRPVWVGDRLILARRVGGNGETVVQGCWLDWPQLKTRLLAEAADLLPEADLVPVNGDAADDPSRMLAGLPVRLVVNEVAGGWRGQSDAAAGRCGWAGARCCWPCWRRRRCCMA